MNPWNSVAFPLHTTMNHPLHSSFKEAHQAFHSGISAPNKEPRDSLDYTPQQIGGKDKDEYGERTGRTQGEETDKHKEEWAKRPQSLQEKL